VGLGLSNLGIFHTLIGIVAIFAAMYGFIKNGKIDLGKSSGKIYFYFTLVTSVTALRLSSIQGVNPGHILALLVIILIVAAYFFNTKKQGSNKFRYFETFFLTFSFLLSMIPTINETLTRIPVGHPLASGPKDPLIAKTLLVVFILFIIGSVIQFRRQRILNSSINE